MFMRVSGDLCEHCEGGSSDPREHFESCSDGRLHRRQPWLWRPARERGANMQALQSLTYEMKGGSKAVLAMNKICWKTPYLLLCTLRNRTNQRGKGHERISEALN